MFWFSLISNNPSQKVSESIIMGGLGAAKRLYVYNKSQRSHLTPKKINIIIVNELISDQCIIHHLKLTGSQAVPRAGWSTGGGLADDAPLPQSVHCVWLCSHICCSKLYCHQGGDEKRQEMFRIGKYLVKLNSILKNCQKSSFHLQ